VTYCREQTKLAPERSRRLIGEVIDDFSTIAVDMLAAANEGMADLVRAGYGVEPVGFYGEVMRLMHLRLRSIGYVEGDDR